MLYKLLLAILLGLTLSGCSPLLANENMTNCGTRSSKVNVNRVANSYVYHTIHKKIIISIGPDYESLSQAINRLENGPTLSKGELYGIHSVHYKDRQEAHRICIRTARHAWERYHALKGLKSTKMGYLEALSKKYCPVNHSRWAYLVGYYYHGGV